MADQQFAIRNTPEVVKLIRATQARRKGNPNYSEILLIGLRALDAYDRNGVVTAHDLLDPIARIRRRP